MDRTGRTRIWLYTTLSTIFISALIAGASLPLTSTGLRATYKTGESILGKQIDRHLAATTGRMLRTSAFNLWTKSTIPVPKEYPSYTIEWSGTLTLPKLSKVLSSGFVRHRYRDATFLGPPVSTAYQPLIAFKTESATERTLRPVGIEWHGYFKLENSLRAAVVSRAPLSGKLHVYVDDTLVTDSESSDFAKKKGRYTELAAGRHHIRVRYQASGGTHDFGLVLKDRDGKTRSIVPTMPPQESVGQSTLIIETNLAFTAAIGSQSVSQLRASNETKQIISNLREGSHPIRITLTDPRPDDSFHIYLSDDLGFVRQLPVTALHPDSQQHTYLARLLTASGAVLFIVVALTALIGALRQKTKPPRYFEFVWRYRFAHMFWCIATAGLFVRLWQYDLIPWLWETVDEYKVVWVGWNLLTTGVPSSWSWPGVYSSTSHFDTFGGNFLIAAYQFHPPPIFPLLIGLVAFLSGAQEMGAIGLTWIRLVPILLSMVTLGIVYLLTKEIFSKRAALLATLVFATLPTAAVTARLVKAEALLTTLLLGLLLVIQYDSKDRSPRRSGLLTVLICALAVVTKEIGIAVGAIGCAAWLQQRRYGVALLAIVGTLLGLALYAGYGWWLNWEAFQEALRFNTQLGFSIRSFLKIFTSNSVTEASVGPGWTVWLWIAALSLTRGNNRLIALALAGYTLFLGASRLDMDYYGLYGWYRIPLYPLLSIGAGVFLSDLYEELDPLRAMLFLLVAVATSLSYAKVPGFLHTGAGVRALCAVLMLPFFLYFCFPTAGFRRAARASACGLICIFSAANILIILDFISLSS